MISARTPQMRLLQHFATTRRGTSTCRRPGVGVWSSSNFHTDRIFSFNSFRPTTNTTVSHRFVSSTSSLTQDSYQQHVLPHDLGGSKDRKNNGTIPIDNNEELQTWEQQCHALFAVLASKGVFKTDQLRRAVENLTPKQYEAWSYYGRWAASMVTLLIDQGMISDSDLREALFGQQNNNNDDDNPSSSLLQQTTTGQQDPTITTPPQPLFGPGDMVKVKSYQDGVEWRRPHIRTPGYVYGVNGRIVDVCGKFGDPSLLAFGVESPKIWLYRVEMSMRDLWPEQKMIDDTLSIEIYQHWLEASNVDSGHDEFQNIKLLNHNDHSNDCSYHDDSHHHHHHHHHDDDNNDDDDDDHFHYARPEVEKRAVESEGPPRGGKDLFLALLKIVLDKELASRDDIRSMIESLESAGRNLTGRTLIVKAWMDPTFEEHLLDDAASAALELGIQTSNPNAPTVLTVVRNTPTIHNLIVCTLCSCYPSGLLGIAPVWYKSSEFRSRAVREPREVLKEFGTILQKNQKVRVHDSTADHRYLVLPQRPKGTESWSEEELKQLVTRDSMLGVTTPTPVV